MIRGSHPHGDGGFKTSIIEDAAINSVGIMTTEEAESERMCYYGGDVDRRRVTHASKEDDAP